MVRSKVELWTEGQHVSLLNLRRRLPCGQQRPMRTVSTHLFPHLGHGHTLSVKMSRLREHTLARPFTGQDLLLTQLRPSVLLPLNLGEACDAEQLSGATARLVARVRTDQVGLQGSVW